LGDPKKLRKKYQTPAHPWNKEKIEAEKILLKEYGLNRKKEIHIADSFLKKYKNISKRLIADSSEQGAKERVQTLRKLKKLGLISEVAQLDDVLSLELKDVLERRLQTLLFRKGLARSVRQARQFITHGHVSIGEKAITSPSYLTSLEEENNFNFKVTSALNDEEHPERVSIVKEIQEEKEKIAGKHEPKENESEPEQGNATIKKDKDVKEEKKEEKDVEKEVKSPKGKEEVKQ
jgi:small subunit ribosomal protein S4